jgi:autotransporter-associated beta strand protein
MKPKSSRKPTGVTRFLLASFLLAAANPALAQITYTWANSNVTNTTPRTLDWFSGGTNTQATWDTSPGSQGSSLITDVDTIQFFENNTTALSNTVNAVLNSTINNGGTAVQPGTLTLSGRASSTQTRTLTVNIGGDALNFSAATGTINLSANNQDNSRNLVYNLNSNIQLGTSGSGSALTIQGGGSSTFRIAGGISELQTGGGSIVKSGNSRVTFSGVNTYTGGTTISGGGIQFAKISAMPATGTVAVGTGGTIGVNLGGTDEFTAATSGNGSIGALLNGIGAQGTAVTYDGSVNLLLDTTNATEEQIYSGTITNVGTTLGLIKTGPGTLTLSAINSYTGLTTVASNETNGGTVNVAGDHSAANGGWSIFGTSTVNFQSGSTIAVAAGRNITLQNSAGDHKLNVFGTLTTSSTSNLTIRGRSTVNLESGANWTQGGTIIVQPLNTSFGAVLNVKTGASFTYNGTSTITLAKSTSGGSGGANITISGGTFTTSRGFSNTAAGTGSGTTRLNFSNGGTLKISEDVPALIIEGTTPFGVLTNNAAGGVIDTNGFNTAIGVAISGVGGLTKAGAGMLTLSAANTYAGDTTVSGGTLVLAAENTSNDASRVTLGSAGILKLDYAGTDTVQRLVVNGTRMPNGVYGYDSVDSIAQTINSYFEATGTGTLTVSDTVAPTLTPANIVDDKAGGPVVVNTLVNYTVTFSEEMNASTISAADFGNAGTATFTIGTVTQVSPSAFLVPVTPTSAGTLQLSVIAGADIQDFVNNPLDTTSAIADDTTLTVNAPASGYATWSGGAPADGDANNDGVENAIAWALGAADPAENAIGLLPTLDNTSDPNYLIFTFQRSDLAETDPNTSITVQYGNNLTGWTTAVDDNDNVEIEETDGSPKDTVLVKLKRSTLGSSGNLFVRLNVVVTP